MKAAIYNPYLDTLGGGERYTLTFAKALEKKDFIVDIQWGEPTLKKILEERFSIDLGGLNFVKNINRGDGYDLCFWVSDGSVPMLKARYNFLHFQIPFKDVNGNSLINKMKLFRIKKVICNSYFTKSYIDKEYGVESLVIYPPVDVEKIKSRRKLNQILYVGRFSKLGQAKGQEILAKMFMRMYDKYLKDWKMVIAGGTEVGVTNQVEKLKKATRGYPVKIIESPAFKEIINLYGESKIFWSASGFGVDEKKIPGRVEHFGITVVEAMAGGAVPIIFEAGGHKEIVVNGQNGFLWGTERELEKRTLELSENSKLFNLLSKNAKESAKIYEKDRFEAEIYELLDFD